MIKSQLIDELHQTHKHLRRPQLESLVDHFFDFITTTFNNRERIELRGFGVFSCRKRDERNARNPRTGESVAVDARCIPTFKPSKLLKKALLQTQKG